MNQINTIDLLNVPLLRSQHPNRRSKVEMDMTSMVDVTFLLLIFFMVTASFIVQSAFQTPTSNNGSVVLSNEPSPQIEVRVTPLGEFEVAFGTRETQPVNSKHELRRELNDILSTHRGDLSAIVLPNAESEHQDVIEAVDVLTGIKIPFSIKLQS